MLVDRPDRSGRREILKVHVAKVRLAPGVDLDQIAGLTTGFTGADLANLVNEAAIVATRRNGEAVTLDDFIAAIERIVAGLEKKSRVLSAPERRRVAYHEMGHALVAATLPGVDPVHKVSIIPRGVGALGYTMQRPTEDRFLLARQRSRKPHRRADGRARRGGADLRRRGLDRRRRRPAAGDRDRDGNGHPLRHERDGRPAHLRCRRRSRSWRDAASSVDASETTEREIDVAVRDLVAKAFDRATDILGARRADLDEGARLLLAQETLTADQFPAIRSTVQPA